MEPINTKIVISDGHMLLMWAELSSFGHNQLIYKTFDVTKHIADIVRKTIHEELQNGNSSSSQ